MIRIFLSSTLVSLRNRYSFCCFFIALFLHPSPTDCSFGVQTTIGWHTGGKQGKHQHHLHHSHPAGRAEEIMVLQSTMGVAARAMGRRSKRLMSIQRASSTVGVVLSLSATPSREANTNDDAVPIITPSSQMKTNTRTPRGSASAGRKRKRLSSTTVPPNKPVSRRLDLEDDTATATFASGSSAAAMVENNDLELTTDMMALINPSQGFVDLEVPPEELRPSNTLTTGQCFHWRVVHPTTTTKAEEPPSSTSVSTSAWGTHDATEWVGTLRLRLFESCESVVLVVRELPDTTLYRPLATTRRRTNTTTENENEEREELHRAIVEYFQLEVGLPELYEEWSGGCPRLSQIADCIPGVRIIRQDPWECLISFICSSNNNIPRITKMLASIRSEYGRPLLRIPATTKGSGDNDRALEYHQLYSFPSLEELASSATDKDLRGKCGMGYRADYILETMKILRGDSKGGEAYLRTVLRNTRDPTEVQTLLCEFKGVGKKVADCVALFSLDQDDAIPVDTHVWNIAIRDYDEGGILKTSVKSLTPSNYQRVGDIFRSRFPNKAGWAHSLLFVAELPSFRSLLPKDLVDEMEIFQNEEKERKKQHKEEKKMKTKK
jgi:N-glycosylase/DNA lyase